MSATAIIFVTRKSHPNLYKCFEDLSICSKCGSHNGRFEMSVTMYKNDQNKFYQEAIISIICEDCGHVRKRELSMEVPEEMAKELYEFYQVRGDL